LKLYILVNALPVINKISVVPLPLTLGKRLTPAFTRFTEVYKLYMKHHKVLIETYGTSDPETGKKEVLPDQRENFDIALGQLMRRNVVWEAQKIPCEDFEGHLQLSLAEFHLVSWFFG
jgi:hypothetical protein